MAILLLGAAPPVARAQFSRFQNYADEQGLGNLDVTALNQDRDGYILVGTQGGLFRYDGTMLHRDAVGLPAEWIKQVALDARGHVWVVMEQGSLFVGDGGRFEPVDIGRTTPAATTVHLLAVSGDTVVFDADGILLRTTIGSGRPRPFAPLLDAATLSAVPALAHARFVVSDPAGGLLAGCGGALCRITPGALGMQAEVLDTAQGLPADIWRTALRTDDGTLWLRSLGLLAWRRPGQERFTVIAVPGQHSSYFAGQPDDLQLLPDHAGGVLTQGDEQLLDWTGAAWRIHAPHLGGLPNAAITSMLWDREGSLWLGSQGFGVFRSAGLGVWEHWTREDGLPSSTIWSMARLPDGRIWVATDAGTAAMGLGTAALKGENFIAAPSRAGRLWLAPVTEPLLRVEAAGGPPARLPSIGNVFNAVVDRADRLWLTTENALFTVSDADAPDADLHVRLALSGQRCHVLDDPAAMDAGVVWAICRNGVFRSGPDGLFQRAIAPALLHGQPWVASFTTRGDLWIGTQAAGILRFRVNGDRVEPLPSLDSVVTGTDSVMFLYRDHRGRMWVGSAHGIDLFDGHTWRRFDSSEGPISNDVDQDSVLEDADGSMWFGTSHGLSHLLDPAHLPALAPLHPLVTGLFLGRRALPFESASHVPWSAEPLVVRFDDLDYARGRGLMFRYRLRGVDAGWNDTVAHEVRYGQLPPGVLRFDLVVVDTVHRTVSDSVGFTIRIDPPWWRRPWFFASCLLGAAAVIVAAERFRVRLLLRQRRHLEEMVGIRTAEIEQARRELQLLALSDTLTGLPNRHAIMGQLDAAIADARVAGTSFAVLICDIDHFKLINDGHGHLAGDAVLAAFGSRLADAVRSPEAAGRYGGEEFLVILPQVLPGEVASADRATALLAEVTASPFRVGGAARAVTCSGGLAMLRPDDGTVSLLARADAALYRAKADGRNRIEEERDPLVLDRAATVEDPDAVLRRDLRAAINRGEFILHYQPILDVGRDHIVAYEALLRWRSPNRGDVAPALFIPFAERNDLMPAIDAWVIRTACREAAGWQDDVRVAVNLSPSHFHQPGLVQTVAAALAEARLPARRLELEVTETAMIVDIEAAAVVLAQLRALGISIALDDFGTGYSSLNFVGSLPFDRIKIDRSFVRNLGVRPEAAAVIGGIIHLCAGIGTSVTAEGIETPEQLELLRAVGCDELQGFHIGRPAPMISMSVGGVMGWRCGSGWGLG